MQSAVVTLRTGSTVAEQERFTATSVVEYYQKR